MTSSSYYKFLRSEDVDKVLKDGTVKLSSCDYFRKLEEKEFGLIADRLEGASEITTPNTFVLTEGSQELDLINNAGIFPGMFDKFTEVSGGGKIVMGGTRFISTVPGFLYCASHGDFDKLKIYHTQEAELKYDACLQIADMHQLMSRIFETGVIQGTNQKFLDAFERYNIGPVAYEARSVSVMDAKMPEPSIFKKALAFESQSEYRIHFLPREATRQSDTLIVKISDPGSIFKCVFVDTR